MRTQSNLIRALRVDPRFVEALDGKGFAFNNIGRYEGAIVLFDKAFECHK